MRTPWYAVGIVLTGVCMRCVDDPVVTPDPDDVCPGCTTAVELDSSNFAALTGAAGRVAMVEFYSNTCPACQAMMPVIDSVARRYEGLALVGRVNTQSDDTLSEAFAIQWLPTCVFLEGGVEYDRVAGAATADFLSAIIERGLQKSIVPVADRGGT